MRTLGLRFLLSLCVVGAALCPSLAPAEQRYPPFIPTPGTDTEVPELAKNDRDAIELRAKQQFAGRAEEDVYADAARTHMHYFYTGFLHVFPSSTHTAEIKAKLTEFRQFEAKRVGTGELVISTKELRERFNWNATERLYPYANMMAGQVRMPETGRLVYFGPLVLGNLQLRGTWRFLSDGLHVETGVTIVYPNTKIPRAS